MKSCTHAIVLVFSLLAPVFAQRGGGNPYSTQLRTDPDAGTIQGIQRYGHALNTDPAEGDGYPYFVFPSVGADDVVGPSRQQRLAIASRLQLLSSQIADMDRRSAVANSADRAALQADRIALIQEQAALTALWRQTRYFDDSGVASLTSGLRSPLTPEGADVRLTAAGAFDATTAVDPLSLLQITHQPLIQIKLRVVEVIRNDAMGASSTLDYVRNVRGLPSLVADRNINNINRAQRNLSSVTRFNDDRLGLLNIEAPAAMMSGLQLIDQTNAGALVNLTSRHLNLVAKFLAVELNADVLTAPELITTNGESVEFTAGSKLPFLLGTATVEDSGEETVNHFFYKHVGTYVSVRPRIVNFGLDGRGKGNAPIVSSDIVDWNGLIRFMINEKLTNEQLSAPGPHPWEAYTRTGRLVPLEIQEEVLEVLNQYARSDLCAFIMSQLEANPQFDHRFIDLFPAAENGCGPGGCQWRPEDCTIDLEIVARFSGAGTKPAEALTAGSDLSGAADLNFEDNVRAVANILQVKSGNGVVMAGLIGESEVEDVQKTPVLGDIPIVGALFRSKAVGRVKSEILIFIEARVLDARPEVAHGQSIEDVDLGIDYVTGGTLDNALDYGVHRAGLAAYLPPGTPAERTYWARLGRNVKKIEAARYDALR